MEKVDEYLFRETLLSESMVCEPYESSGFDDKLCVVIRVPTHKASLHDLVTRLFSIVGSKKIYIQIYDIGLVDEGLSSIVGKVLNSSCEKVSEGDIFSCDDLEEDILVRIFELFVLFEWKVYFYVLDTKSTLYAWEGELIDLWSIDSDRMNKFGSIRDIFDNAH